MARKLSRGKKLYNPTTNCRALANVQAATAWTCGSLIFATRTVGVCCWISAVEHTCIWWTFMLALGLSIDKKVRMLKPGLVSN